MDDLNDFLLEDVWECEGSKAAGAGKVATENPYPPKTRAGQCWRDGYVLAMHSLQRSA